MSAALALLSSFSVWQAWRHNPLYSPRSGLWLLAKILVMLALTAGAVATVMALTAGEPVVVQMGILLTSIALCTVALVLGISAVATPRIARLQTQLPPGVRITRMFRKGVTHWLRVAFVYFGCCALLALAPDPLRSFALVLAVLAGLLCAVMLPLGYVMAWRMDRAVTALEISPWVHWQYPVELRSLWCRAQVERLKRRPATFILRRDWLKLLGLCASLVIPCLILMPGTWLERGGWGLVCCALLGLFIELAAAEERRAPARLARRLKATPADAWFGRDGLVCDGNFYTWLDPNAYLQSAALDVRPPRSLCFTFTNIGSGAYGAPAVSSASQNVLVPPDVTDEELTSLQQHLRGRCPTAQINLA